jgi:hypothetical protein
MHLHRLLQLIGLPDVEMPVGPASYRSSPIGELDSRHCDHLPIASEDTLSLLPGLSAVPEVDVFDTGGAEDVVLGVPAAVQDLVRAALLCQGAGFGVPVPDADVVIVIKRG